MKNLHLKFLSQYYAFKKNLTFIVWYL